MFVYRFFTEPINQQITISEQELLYAMQSRITDPFQNIVMDVQPSGIVTTVQFMDGVVATVTVKLNTSTQLMTFTLEGMTMNGGTQTHSDALYQQLPVLIMGVLDDVLPSGYTNMNGAYLTNSGIVIGIR
jgi:hypothetical protein